MDSNIASNRSSKLGKRSFSQLANEIAHVNFFSVFSSKALCFHGILMKHSIHLVTLRFECFDLMGSHIG